MERSRPIKQRFAAIGPSPTPPAQEYVNPELDSSVSRGHVADLRSTKNLPSSSPVLPHLLLFFFHETTLLLIF